MPRIDAPPPLLDGNTTVTVDGSTVRDVLDRHAASHGPELRDAVVDGDAIARHVDLYVDGTEIRRRNGLDTRVEADDLIRIIPRVDQRS
jgi:hypothetical protein